MISEADTMFIKPGTWLAELDEAGKVTKVNYDEAYCAIFDFSREEKGSIKEQWTERVHPDDKDRLEAYVQEVMGKHPEGMNFDIEYRMLTKWGYHWFHDYGKCFRREDGSIARCDGVIFDIQDIVDKENARRALVENNVRVLALEDNLEALYDVELDTGRYDVFIKGEAFDKSIKERLLEINEYFSDLRANIDAVIYPADRDGLYDVLNREALRKELQEKDKFDYYYRVVVNDRPVWFKIRVVYKNAEKKNVIIGVFNAAEEVRAKRQAERERNELITQMIGGESLYIVNPKADKFRILNQNDYLALHYPADEAYTESVTRYINTDVLQSDRKMLLEALSLEALVSHLAEGNEYIVRYRDISSGMPRWYEMRAVKLSGSQILCGFTDKDNEIIIHTLDDMVREDNFAIFSIDLDSEQLKILRKSPWDEAYAIGDILPYKSVLGRIAKMHVNTAKDFYEKLCDLDFLKKALTAEDKMTHSYISAFVEGKKWVTVTVYVLSRHDDGTPSLIALCFSILDTLGADRAEMQLRLEDALERAEAANTSKNSFLFSMSHDIRTPMNAIKGFTTMALKYLDDKERAADYLNKINISGRQLLNLINQVLEMSRIEAGKIEIETKPVNVLEKFDSFVTIFAEQAKEKGIEFHYLVVDIKHFNVLADEGRMGQITLNIAGNALKYTPEGGKIDFFLKEIPCEREGWARYTLTVADTGIGMSKEYIGKLFEPFTREKSSTVSKIQGTGLGMSIVKRLVDLLGGTIEVQSELGKGTRFDITIDLQLVGEAETNPREEQEIIISTKSFMGKRVLLVEDNELNREIAKDILEEFGLTVEEADDGDVAVEMVKAAGERGEYDYYAAVLMDIQMPRMNGYEATRAIRELDTPDDCYLPIIAMTANAFEEDRRNALAAGMDDHLAKPIEIDKLKATLAKFL